MLAIFLKEEALIKKKSKNKDLVYETRIGKKYISKFEKIKSNIVKDIVKLSRGHRKTVIFGAGHRTSIFINILNISKLISYVIDDDRKKNGLFIPGTNLEIKNSNSLLNTDVNLCLLSLNLNMERKIINNFKKIREKTIFFSISPDSKFVLPTLSN